MSGDLFARYREEDRARNAALTLGAKKPEQAADIRRLSQKTGLPPGAVAQDPDSVRRQVERDRLNNLQITSPLVAKWVTQPGNYDLAQDDIDALQAVEKGFGELYQARGKGTKDDPYAPATLRQEYEPAVRPNETQQGYTTPPPKKFRVYTPLTDEQVYEAAPQGAYVRMADGTLRRREAGVMDLLAELPRRGVNLLGSFVDLGINGIRAVTPDLDPNTLGGMVLAKPTGEPVAGNPRYQPDVSFKDIRESETALDALVKLPEFIGEGLLFSAPDMAGAFVAMPVYIAARTEEIAQSRAQNDGRDAPDVADYAIASVAAQIEGRLERFATGRLPGMGTVTGKPLTRIAKETAVQAGTEGVEEFVPYAAETTGTVAGFNSMDALDATAGGAIIGGGLGLGVQGGKEAYRVADRSASGIIRRAVDIDAARGEKAVLDNLVAAVDTTKLKSLAPDKLEEAVDNIAAGTVFLPIGEVTTYFQSASLDPREAVADLTGSDTAYDEAVATGGEIAVPLGRYAARVKPEAHAVLGNTARLKPGQAIKPNAEMPDAATIEADIRAAIAEAQTNPARADDASGEVYDAVFGQLVGNTDRTAANQYAATVQAFYGNMARRLGVTPMELYGQFRLNLLGNSQAKPGRVDGAIDPILDAIRAKRGFTDKEVKGPGLVSSLIAAGGIRPDSVGGANLKKMVDKGRVGLFNKDGMTLDEAVQWAKANGFAFDTATEASGLYDSDGFDINALSSLIEQDIRQGVYAAENLNEKRAGFNAAMDGVMQMLDEKGIDINAMSNAEIKALLEGDAQTYEQAGPDILESPEFRRWFGDRSIEELEAEYAALVDADGNNRTDGGHHIDTDLVRELSAEYRANRSLSNELHPYASALAKRLFANALARPVRDGREPVVAFLAGGGGSGKSTAVGNQLDQLKADITFDGTFSKLENAKQNIDASIASGRGALVMFVYRSPEKAADGVISRAAREGRPVPAWALAEAHAGAAKVAKTLAEEYDSNGQVLIKAFWNDGEKGAAREMPVEELPNVDQQAAEQTFRSAAESARNQGRISQAIADAILASSDVGKVPGQSEPERKGRNQDSVTGRLNQPADGGKADDNRGQVTIRKQADGTIDFDITLLKKANFSTFLHESGHVYLEIMRALALRDNAPADIKADWQKISDYLGVKPGDALTVDQHERWARSFEAYLREGKAPSKSLRAAFASFKLWLTRIYTSAKALNVELSDDIRGVMDRMLASEAEIQEAAKAQNLGALFKDRVAEDWDQAMFEEYARQVEAVQAEAEAEVAAKLLKAEQDAQQAWYKAELKAMQEAVALELSREPVFVAQQILRNGRYGNGDPAPDSIKVALDKGDLLDNYGAEFLKRMKGLYRNEGGISADEAAVLFGFSTGRELVEALVNADSFGNAVKAEAQRRMDERHPDPMKDGTLPQQAMNALHSDKMGEVLVKEINLLEKRAGKPATTLQVMKEAARRMIGAKALKDVRPSQYLLAEQKAGREALEAAARQDWEAARVARRMQLLNHQLYRAATDAQEAAVKQHKFLRRFVDGDRRAEIGKASEEMLAGIDALLAGVDWRASATRDTGRGRPWRELTVDDLKALHDEVKEAYHVATREGIIMDGDRKVQAAVVGQEMAQSVADAHGEKPTQYGIETTGEKATKGWHVVRALAGAATDLARELDGFRDGGAVWSNTVRIIHEAMNNRVLPALQKAQEREAQIFLKHYTKKELRRLSRDGRRINGVPGTWSKEQILALALNWGNQGNRDAVLGMVRKPLAPEQVAKLLGTLDARDWAFVQDIWDMIDAHWPEISDAAQRRKGLRPERVERMPFTVSAADGKVLAMRGGYYPLKGEADSAKTDMETVDDFYDAILTGSFSKASTKDGHTIERVGFGGRTVRLDLGVINQHQAEVIRDIHLGDAVNYVHQTLSNGDFTAAVEKAGMLEHQKALKAWLKDVAAGEMGLRSWHEKSMRALRTNFTASVLTFKLMSALIQITGVVQSSVVVGHRTMLAGIGRYAKNPMEAGRYVNEASNFMRLRGQTQIDAIEQAANARSSAYASGKATMLKWGYYMIGRVQRIVDVTTWMAAENKGIELFGDDRAKVIAYADDVVKRAQGSGAFEDKNSVQRGTLGDNVRQSEHIRGFTVLMGYMMAKNNVVVERAAKARKQGGIKGAASMAVAMTELFVVEAMILAAIRGQWPEDEDEDGIFDDLLKYAAAEGFYGLIGGIPGISQLGTEMRGYDAKGTLGNLFEEVANAGTQVDQGEADKALLKSVVNVAGLTTGVPSGQINKTIDALAAAEDGEDVALYQYVTGPEKK